MRTFFFPQQLYFELLCKPESGYIAEFTIFGCSLEVEPADDEHPYAILLENGEVSNMFASSKLGGNHKITEEFVKYMEGILSGQIIYETNDELQTSLRTALYPKQNDHRLNPGNFKHR